MKKPIFAAVLLPFAFTPALKAEYLFENYLDPGAGIYYQWPGFTSAGPEYSGGGHNLPFISNAPEYLPQPVLSQLSPGAQLAGTENGIGRIYSHNEPLHFSLTYDHGAPLEANRVLFQFQTSGAWVDFSSIALKYTVGTETYYLEDFDYIREFRKDGSTTALGFSTLSRMSLSWDISELIGLGAQNFEIVWNGSSIGMSFHQAILDMYSGPSVVAEERKWIAGGTNLSWSDNGNWQGGSVPVEHGNVRFENAGEATVVLNANHNVGELSFNSADDVQLNIASGAKLGIYTGVFTSAESTGTYEVSGDVELGALSIFQIDAGTVEMNGSISGDYGLVKRGEGTLRLLGDNTFGSGLEDKDDPANDKSGYLILLGGVLEISGTNSYTGVTTVVEGELRVIGDVIANLEGALGKSDKNITIGANPEQYGDENASASLVIVGDHTISRTIKLRGNVEKSIGAADTENGAVYSGKLDLNETSEIVAHNVTLFARNSTDRFTLSGEIVNGSSDATLTIGGDGTVVFTGGNKTYQHNTDITSGTLLVDAGVSVTASLAMTVRSGATLTMNGTLSGGTSFANRTLVLEGGARLSGSGSVLRSFTLANGTVLAAGNSVGSLTTTNQTWGDGGILEFEIDGNGWDKIDLIAAGAGSSNTPGKLTLDLTGSDTFLIRVLGLTESMISDGDVAFDGTTNATWTFLTAVGGIEGFDESRFIFEQGGYLSGYHGEWSIEQQGDNLVLTYVAPIPEPSAYALIGAGAALYGFLRRRRKAA